MKRRQFIKLLSASILAGVVAPVCVLPMRDPEWTDTVTLGEMEHEGIIQIHGTGSKIQGYHAHMIIVDEPSDVDFKYQFWDNSMRIRYFGKEYNDTGENR